MPDNPKPVILNVDDDDGMRCSVSRLLAREGFDVVEARTGAEALARAAEHPDLIVLDVNLPDMSGLDVCNRLKTDARTQTIPVLHLSATAVGSEDRVAGLERGADAYLTHPIDGPVLVATIRALLRARKAESDARRAARAWQATFDAVSHGIAVLDRDGRIVQANRAMSALTGKAPQHLTGVAQALPAPASVDPPGAWPFERAKDTRRRETAEVKAGDRWFQVTADPLLDDAGEFTGAVGTILEITGHKRGDQERDALVHQLENEHTRLAAVLQQLPVGVVLAEAPSGRLVLANEQVPRIFRHPAFQGADDIAGYAVYRGFHPDGRPYEPADWPLARSITTGEVVTNEEIEILRGDGTRGTALFNSAPIRDRQGFIIAAVAVFLDISERKHLEDQLRQSQKMEAIGRLAGGVAHDFNNLLTIIGGYGQMVLDNLEPSDVLRRDMESILEAATRASALTRQLLTVSRRQVVQPKVFDINRLLSRTNRMLKRVIGEDIELATSLKAQHGRIKADPGQFEQVLLNLAVNARDAMPKGGRLTIETADVELGGAGEAAHNPSLAPGRYILVVVADTGAGMSPEVMRHLFEPFFTTKGKGKGTGLGLSTVYGIVKQAGGEVLVSSEVGKGAAFRIYIPAAPERESQDPAAAPAAARRGSETILLVEDEPEVRRLAAEMLGRQGYTVLEAGSGIEAVGVWLDNHERIDLLLTDVVMPKMSGQQLAAELKSSSPNLKVVYMSGYTEDVVARHGGVSESTQLIQKPFTSDVLARTIRAVLDEA